MKIKILKNRYNHKYCCLCKYYGGCRKYISYGGCHSAGFEVDDSGVCMKSKTNEKVKYDRSCFNFTKGEDVIACIKKEEIEEKTKKLKEERERETKRIQEEQRQLERKRMYEEARMRQDSQNISSKKNDKHSNCYRKKSDYEQISSLDPEEVFNNFLKTHYIIDYEEFKKEEDQKIKKAKARIKCLTHELIINCISLAVLFLFIFVLEIMLYIAKYKDYESLPKYYNKPNFLAIIITAIICVITFSVIFIVYFSKYKKRKRKEELEKLNLIIDLLPEMDKCLKTRYIIMDFLLKYDNVTVTKDDMDILVNKLRNEYLCGEDIYYLFISLAGSNTKNTDALFVIFKYLDDSDLVFVKESNLMKNVLAKYVDKINKSKIYFNIACVLYYKKADWQGKFLISRIFMDFITNNEEILKIKNEFNFLK